MKINLDQIEDKLEGNWWHYIRISDFAFQNKILKRKELEVLEDDILIHKQIMEDDRYPTTCYHVIMDDEPYEIEGKEVREKLSEKCSEIINKTQKLPFGCQYKKFQTNGLVIINYNPNNYDNFQLKIHKDLLNLDKNDVEEFFLILKPTKINPLADSDDISLKIDPISDFPLLNQVSIESGSSKAFIINAKIKEIDLRKSYFQGSETIFYLIQVENGQMAPDAKKTSLKRNFEKLNVKCSENAFKKFDLKIGDMVSFNGKVKNDKRLKFIFCFVLILNCFYQISEYYVK